MGGWVGVGSSCNASDGGMVQAVMRAMGSWGAADEGSLTHGSLCSPVGGPCCIQ